MNKAELKEFLTKAGAPAEEIDATAEQVSMFVSVVCCALYLIQSSQIATEIGGDDGVISIQELIGWYEKQA